MVVKEEHQMNKTLKFLLKAVIVLVVVILVGLLFINNISYIDKYEPISASQKAEVIARIENVQSGKPTNSQVFDKFILYDTCEVVEDGQTRFKDRICKISVKSFYDFTDANKPLECNEINLNVIYKAEGIKTEKEIDITFKAYVDADKHEAYIAGEKKITNKDKETFKGLITGVNYSFRDVITAKYGISIFNLNDLLLTINNSSYTVKADGDYVKTEKQEKGTGSGEIETVVAKDVNIIKIDEYGQYSAQHYYLKDDNKIQGYYYSEINSTNKKISMPSNLTEYSSPLELIKILDKTI